MFLRNVWYVAELADTICRNLQPLTILGDRIVLYRLSNGDPVALEDACPHRKLPLSMGTLKEDTIECGYHGLRFDCTGHCIAAPTQDLVPRNAIVRSYPVCDKFGLVWIWMGEPAMARHADIPKIGNFDNAAWKISRGDAMSCRCHYLHLVDNLLDPTHVAWVHKSSFSAAGTEDTSIDVLVTESGVIASRWILGREPPPFYAELLKSTSKVDRLQHYEVQFPSVAINKSVFVPAGKGGAGFNDYEHAYVMVSYNFLTPIDNNNTRYFWLQHRNTNPNDVGVTERIAAGTRAAFEEDREILEAVHRGMESAATPSITLGVDVASVQFRRLLKKKIAAESSSN